MEEWLITFFDKAPLLISFIAGILTFVSPCVLPLIPAYLSYISEVSLSELKAYETLDFKMRLVIVRNALFFVLGMGIVFVLLGAVAARILSGGILLSPIVAYFAGGILIIFGLHTARVIQIPFLNYQKTFSIHMISFNFLRDFFTPFLLGVSFSLGWTPCVGPILAGIISLASLEANEGVMLMVIYTLGFSLPFLLCAFLVGYIFAFLEHIKKYFKWIEWCAGGLLIVIGILIMSGKMAWLSNYLVKVFA
ncbi:cytochrome c biogenesis protein CcdA [Helicobacter canadensis]|uniref:Cytochrome c biogenesis protein n=1 Tax=Helicobacter canadensis MIT 98-5491 TaxID=537970 RepID=C5ZWV9_9HELI|nr:cytochrome c biogenesis protein CcdA [Helicobacter canadensis]EES89627.1 cytochrome c biogenesis protein [Helicobacter canadensis MIT 98-5491]EFR48418.1 putative cytochrome C-type biogenesis protein CcdA [Helicobacter canadensis MIT 98-5491]STO99663.1 cytochrome c-type biogenesis protein CcdA [Helicobacter canadensis]